MLTDADRMLDACYIGDVETLRALIESGVDVNVRYPGSGGTALREAVTWKGDSSHSVPIERHAAVIEFLLENGADPNIADEQGDTPLHCAALKADKFLVRRLLDAGADPNAKKNVYGSHVGDAPLHSACMLEKKDSAACVQMLIQAGARVNVRDEMGKTPLYWAVLVMRKDPDTLVKVLLRAGADIDMVRQGRGFSSRANLDLITAVEKAGGWPAYVLAHRRVVVGLVTKCAPLPADGLVTKCAPLPTDAAAHVVSFLWPEGGF